MTIRLMHNDFPHRTNRRCERLSGPNIDYSQDENHRIWNSLILVGYGINLIEFLQVCIVDDLILCCFNKKISKQSCVCESTEYKRRYVGQWSIRLVTKLWRSCFISIRCIALAAWGMINLIIIPTMKLYFPMTSFTWNVSGALTVFIIHALDTFYIKDSIDNACMADPMIW